MQKTHMAMRRAILRALFDHLKEYYGVDWSRDTIGDPRLSTHQIDAMLAFKSDATLNELRAALDRLDDGSYGVCLGCRHEIDRHLLSLDPARRLCGACEKEFTQTPAEEFAQNAWW